MLLPPLEGPTPWTNKPLLNDPERFQFAIVTDRTGGHRPGVWMDAVNKLNMLRPEFVVSVGDLIEGYTDDEQQAKAEWDEFVGFVDQLDMKFFFVAGNHDVTNPILHRMWRERFGKEYYSFDYKGVHFVCLCSEEPRERISEEQLAWISKDLQEHSDARWTLVFLHKPLWTYAERDLAEGKPDQTNWKKVEQLLIDRPHTVFAGHVHHYVQYRRNEREYYSLATTGGVSQLRGDSYGEFDHVTWLTMEKDGPQIANLRLDGILAADVVDEQTITRLNAFLKGTAVEVAPILMSESTADRFSDGEIGIRVSNKSTEVVKLSGELEGLPLKGLTVDPGTLDLTVPPGTSKELRVRIAFTEPMEFEQLFRTAMVSTLKTVGEDPLTSERVIPVVIDRRFEFPTIAELPPIDGMVKSWPERSNATPEKPLLLGNTRGWQGVGDGSAKFFARHVPKNDGPAGEQVYVAVRVKDDRVISAVDRVELLIDPRPVEKRSTEPRYTRTGLTISAFAPTESGEVKVDARRFRRDRSYRGVKASGIRTEDGYDLEFAIPTKLVKEIQGRDWHSLQGTVVLHDADEPDEEPTQVVWRGTDRVRELNTGFGHFVREK
ncbi:MAG: metallophosphoesterase [Lacipirellulaceae bacterium]